MHLLDRRHQVWNLGAPVVAISREHLDRRIFDPGQHPVAIKLDLVKPIISVPGNAVDQGGQLRF
ncbi:hypothetical protein D3C87_1223100 [compost metagenome]